MTVANGFPPDRPALPAAVVEVVNALDDGLTHILHSNFASLFLYGALAFPHPDRWLVDVDFHVLLAQPLDDATRGDIRQLYEDLAAKSDLGTELDGYFLTLADARVSDPPRHQLNLAVRDEAWALHRAHLLAGRFFAISGLDPRAVVPVPTWNELEGALRQEVRFIEMHPQHRAFGILNACRVLYSLEAHDVVVSKYAAATWARTSFPAHLREAVDAALRAYSSAPETNDDAILRGNWDEIVRYVRETSVWSPARRSSMTQPEIDTDAHRAMAVAANARVWSLLENEHRSAADDRELVHAAHASLWHWLNAGTALHEQRGEWLVSHVYAVTGRAEPALAHAKRCLAITEAEGFTGFDLGYAYEAMARACAVAGDAVAGAEWRVRADGVGKEIADDEDRAIFEADLAAGTWERA